MVIAADPLAARATEGEVDLLDLVLDLFERVQNHGLTLLLVDLVVLEQKSLSDDVVKGWRNRRHRQ